MSIKCLKCFRPKQTCFCDYITPIKTDIKFVFLMHPQEAYKQKTGTGRLASLSITDSEIIIDSSFNNNKRVQELLLMSDYYPMILYPAKDAIPAESLDFKEVIGKKTLLVFLVDATWALAKKMLHRSSSLKTLPKLTFSNEYRSKFSIKTQPKDFCLSTIETSYYLIKELKKSGLCPKTTDASNLLDIFNKMVKFQKNCETIGKRAQLN